MPTPRSVVGEKPIKVDTDTDRRVTQLAYFMGCSKKAVVREAVAEYAEARLSRLTAELLTFEDLPVRDRLALSRGRLIREFAAHGGTGIRVMRRPSGSGASEEPREPEVLELLADTRLGGGGGAAVVLSGVARAILKAPVRVTSLTALRLFNKPGHRVALDESDPL